MPRFLSAFLLIALLSVGEAQAFVRSWPSGTAPCNTTLQACVEGSAASDTILVATNSVIDETVIINKPFVLRAANGYRPILAADRAISGTVNAAGVWTWEVEGFELQRGYIALNINGGSTATARIRNNRVLESFSGVAEISVVKNSSTTTTLQYEISQNELNYFWNTFDGALRAAMQVLDSGSGMSTGRIYGNRVVATGNTSIGILVNTLDRSHHTEVLGNHVFGGRAGSIYLRQGSLISVTGGTLSGLVLNNVVRSVVAGTRFADGIKIDVYDGSLSLRALHNTVVDAHSGIDVYADASVTANGEIGGNLFAYLTSAGLQRTGVTAISDRDNLFFQSSETATTPGLSATSVFADPQLRSVPGDPHLLPGSPAIDQLVSTALAAVNLAYSLPDTDGDGLRRFKRANNVSKSNVLDIGALEAGDETLLHRVPSVAPGSTATVDNLLLNGFAQAAPHVVGNWNPNGFGSVYNDHPVSLRYNTGTARWQLRQEDLLNFSASAAFNLFAPGAGSGRYEHLNTAGNTTGSLTTLNNADLNNHADYILLVTRNPGSGATVSDVATPLALNYLGSSWRVERLDGLLMPANGGFNVYFQTPTTTHTATAPPPETFLAT
ncbi:MAG: hypothetical protein SGI99_05470 [Pseudomonadota bacterium]|nr:hypothetical protein [Pseudomonadota bacterium]